MLIHHEVLKNVFAIIGMLAIACAIVMGVHAYVCFNRYPEVGCEVEE